VSDYTQQVAHALAAAGDQVHVFAPPAAAASGAPDTVQVHRLPDHFGKASLPVLEAHLLQHRGGRILVQYVPHAFGSRAMNIRFCRWVRRMARSGIPTDIMFHEVAYPLERGQALKHKLLALVNRQMARWLSADADRVIISTPAWEPYLREIGVTRPTLWLAIPSNITTQTDPDSVAALRQKFGAPTLIAHFGTYGHSLAAQLKQVLLPLAQRDPTRKLLLLGRGGPDFAASLQAESPDLAPRLFAPGSLDSPDLAAHLAAADLLIQPYPDGISCRRTSAMAALALGVPVCSNVGHNTEPLWSQSRAIAIAPTPAPADILATAESALADPGSLPTLGRLGQSLYQDRFDLKFTIAALRAHAPA